MSTCLHATRGVARLSRQRFLSGAISPRVTSPRPSTPCVGGAIQNSSSFRHYSSGKQPNEPRSKKSSNHKSQSKPEPKPESKPSEPKLENGESPTPTPPKVSEEDRKALWELVNTATASMPKQVKADVEDAVRILQQDRLPPELQELVDSYKKTGSLDLSDSVRLIRFAAKLQAKIVEMRQSEGSEGKESKSESSQDESSSEPRQESRQKDENHERQESSRKDQRNKESSSKGPNPNSQFTLKWDTGTFLASAFVTYMLYRSIVPGENSKSITWQEFRTQFLDKGLVEKLTVINGKRVKVGLNRDAVRAVYPDSPGAYANFAYYFSIGDVGKFEEHLDQAQQELQIPSNQRIPVSFEDSTPWLATLLSFGPTLLLIGGTYWVFRRSSGGGGSGSGIFGMSRSKAKRFSHETDIKVSFKDVAGMDEAKLEIMEFVNFLKEPGMYQKLGAKIPRGAILAGPPGTGKTLLAKATAGESKVPFFSVSGSEFVEMFVGVGASRVRDMFQTARKNAPCIVFIDEIDAIGKSRQKQGNFGGADEREATLNQILTEMDGFNTSEQIVVLAGTNRADVLDSALMRPGRFDRHIYIDKPTMEGRKQIFAVHLKNIVTKITPDYLQGRLAALTPGFSGADIANCVNEAALIAARKAADSVTMEHFEAAIERVIGGLEKKSLVLSAEEKKTVAYHEAGHAICGWFLKWADPLLKVSIIPRGQGALGYAQYLPAGDTYLLTVNQLMDRMAMTLGGRVSEELHFDTVTSGASDDFNKVTRMATAMVTKWGMSNKVGYLFYDDDPSSQLHKPFSEETAKNIDMEVRRIVDEAYKQCHEMLSSKKKEIGLVAEELLEKEMLGREDLIRILGPRPFEDKSEFQKYFGSKGDREGVPGSTPDTNLPGALPLGGGVGPTPVIFQGQPPSRG